MKIIFNGLEIDVEEGDKLNHQEDASTWTAPMEDKETLTLERHGRRIGNWTWTMDTGWKKEG